MLSNLHEQSVSLHMIYTSILKEICTVPTHIGTENIPIHEGAISLNMSTAKSGKRLPKTRLKPEMAKGRRRVSVSEPSMT